MNSVQVDVNARKPKTFVSFLQLTSGILLCIYSFSGVFCEILDILLMFMGMPRLPGVWEYRMSIQNLCSQSGQHFEKEKANTLGKLQRYFLSPVCPTPCLSQGVRAELASLKQYPSPGAGAPFCHTSGHSALPLLWSAWGTSCSRFLKSKNSPLLPASSTFSSTFSLL